MKEKRLLYEVISAKILQGIRAGQFQEILPTEHELALLYDVSRATIRSALQKLNNDNIIKTLHGKGSYITNQMHDIPLRIDKLKGFYQLLEETGQEVNLREMGISKTDSFRCEFQLPAAFYTSPVLTISRLLSSNNQPRIYIQEHLSCNDVRKESFDELPYSVYDLVHHLTGQRIKYTVSRLHPVLPNAEVAEIFGISRKNPILLATEQHYNMLNSYMLFSKIFINNSPDMQIGLIRTQ